MANEGSALGEAIGAHLEIVLNQFLTEIVKKYDCVLVSTGENNIKGKPTKLLLYDNADIAYNIDATITNKELQPIILLEYKYLRYTKHNRDKGSWVCTAHDGVRRRYRSVRSSIAILAGRWSGTSIAMMKSHDITIFLIPFERLADTLSKHNIEFDWEESESITQSVSWKTYQKLTAVQKITIANEMISSIKDDLEQTIATILDNTTERTTEQIVLEIHTNIGEIKRTAFSNIDTAIASLEKFTIDDIFNNADTPSILDKPDNLSK